DPDKFFPWIQNLVAQEGQNILRTKGILAFKDDPKRFAFQGVHMMLDGDHQRDWRETEKRESPIIFTGREWRESMIRKGFGECAACSLFTRAAQAMATTNTPSVADRARPIAAGAAVVGAHFLADTAVFVLGDEALLFVARNGDPQRVVAHGGGILATASDGELIVTGGDDGKVVATKVDMTAATIGAGPKPRRI